MSGTSGIRCSFAAFIRSLGITISSLPISDHRSAANGDIYKAQADGKLTVQKKEGFNTLFGNRRATFKDTNGKEKAKPAGDEWKRSRARREYCQIGYWPDKVQEPKAAYNLFRGWGIEPVAGDWWLIGEHIEQVIASGDKAKADYILDWLAHMVQKPGVKPGVAIVLLGKKGSGKSLFINIVEMAIGRQNAFITASADQLFQQFNIDLASKLLIVSEEAFFAGNHKQNNQLKHLLTGHDMQVEQKFGERLSIQSTHRVMMTSNEDQPVHMTVDERRFLICEVSDHRIEDSTYFQPLAAIAQGEKPETLAAFLHELLTRHISNFNPESAKKIGGLAHAQQKLLGLEPPLQWLLERVRNTSRDGAPNTEDLTDGVWSLKQKKQSCLSDYRYWAKTAQVRGAADYTIAEKFWASLKKLLKPKIFPNHGQFFRGSSGISYVLMPTRTEMLKGFGQLIR
jgi:hypothetical protein